MLGESKRGAGSQPTAPSGPPRAPARQAEAGARQPAARAVRAHQGAGGTVREEAVVGDRGEARIAAGGDGRKGGRRRLGGLGEVIEHSEVSWIRNDSWGETISAGRLRRIARHQVQRAAFAEAASRS